MPEENKSEKMQKPTKTSGDTTCQEMTDEELLALLSHPNGILTRVPSSPISDPAFLVKIIDEITRQNRQEEVDFGAPVGKETL